MLAGNSILWIAFLCKLFIHNIIVTSADVHTHCMCMFTGHWVCVWPCCCYVIQVSLCLLLVSCLRSHIPARITILSDCKHSFIKVLILLHSAIIIVILLQSCLVCSQALEGATIPCLYNSIYYLRCIMLYKKSTMMMNFVIFTFFISVCMDHYVGKCRASLPSIVKLDHAIVQHSFTSQGCSDLCRTAAAAV